MLSFVNDYDEGAHPAILQRLLVTNFETLPSYVSDRYRDLAKGKIRGTIRRPEADVFFLAGIISRPTRLYWTRSYTLIKVYR